MSPFQCRLKTTKKKKRATAKHGKQLHDDNSLAPDDDEEDGDLDDDEEESEDEEENIDSAIATQEDDPKDKEVITSWKDITGLRVYDGNNMVTCVKDLPKLFEAYSANPQLFDAYKPNPGMGVPEQLFWVAYKRGRNGEDKEVPWTTILIDNNQEFLDKWIEQQRPPSKQQERLFPREVQDHAIKVYQRLREETGNKDLHKKLAMDLQKQWGLNPR